MPHLAWLIVFLNFSSFFYIVYFFTIYIKIFLTFVQYNRK